MDMSSGRPPRPPRREGGSAANRPPSRGNVRRGAPAPDEAPRGGSRPSEGRGGDTRRPRPSSTGRAAGGRPRSGPGRPSTGRGGRPGGPRGGAKEGPRRALTAAELRAAEVNAKRARRAPPDPEAERAKIEGREVERWVDEGAIRAEAASAASRAAARPRRNRPPRAVAPDTATRIGAAARDGRRAAVLTERLAQAQDAFDREHFEEARHLALQLVRELPNVAAVHEILGLTAYRMGRWKQAAAELEVSQALHPAVELLPVLADVYRAQHRWADVERVWSDVRELSPSQEVMAEARIVAAGAEADQGDLQGALRTMARATQVPKKVRDHHLRQWYVLGDLYDRAGEPLEAVRWFELVASHDREFVDVSERLRALGR